MLVLTRKIGESLTIGDDIKIKVLDITGKQIKIGISAPSKYIIHREEIYEQIQEENRLASSLNELSLKDISDLWKRRKGDARGREEP